MVFLIILSRSDSGVSGLTLCRVSRQVEVADGMSEQLDPDDAGKTVLTSDLHLLTAAVSLISSFLSL